MISMLFETVGIIGYAIELVGVIIIVLGLIYAGIDAIRHQSKIDREEQLKEFRHNIGQAMLLGLDFLVAGDIIRTVIVSHSITDVIGLGLIVLIRTVLVFTIHLEVEGHWPWQTKSIQNNQKDDSET